MFEPYEWKQILFPELIQSDECRDIYYKIYCYYNMKTEIYDEWFSATSEVHNDIAKYIIQNERIKYPRTYAQGLFDICKSILMRETHKPFNWHMWNLVDCKEHKTQYWINEYKRLKSNGELDFMDKYIQ